MASSALARYQPEGVLGVGPLGKIYSAVDKSSGRRVAFRGFARPNEADADAWQAAIDRFNQELAAAQRLAHPGIARVFEYGEENGLYYVVTEWFDGEALHLKLERDERFTPDQALNLIGQAGRAVEYAIEQGAVHGDLTPFNLIITSRGEAKIVNYGLASCRPKDDSVFRSPEELLGREPDARSDLFALGVLLYCMLEGCHPFWGGAPAETQARILHAPLPPAPSAPPYLQAILVRMMAKRPEERYQSWAAVAADIANGRAPSKPVSPRIELTGPAPQVTPSLSQFKLSNSDVLQLRDRARRRMEEHTERRRLLGGRGARFAVCGLLVVIVAAAVVNRLTEHRVALSAVKGEVEVRDSEGGGWRRAVAGESLERLEEVRTKLGSMARIEIGDGSRMQLGGDSQLGVKEVGLRAGSGARARLFRLSRGRVLSQVRPRPSQQFTIETAALSATARGTEFLVEVSRAGQATVQAVTGSVQASNDHGKQTIAAGQWTTAAPASAPRKPAALNKKEMASLLEGLEELESGRGLAQRLAGLLRTLEDTALTRVLDGAQGLAGFAGPEGLSLKQGSARARALGAMQALVRAMEFGDGSGDYPENLDPKTLREIGATEEMAAEILGQFKERKLLSYRRLPGGYEIKARVDSDEAPLIVAKNGKIIIEE